jgi:vacuolar-type H+-ATPase subunit H
VRLDSLAGKWRGPLNEKKIQQVLDIEKRADEITEQARKDAAQLPLKAEQEAQALIVKARADAEEETRKLLAGAKAEEECARILADADEQVKHTEVLAQGNFARAVSYVLNRVIGRE